MTDTDFVFVVNGTDKKGIIRVRVFRDGKVAAQYAALLVTENIQKNVGIAFCPIEEFFIWTRRGRSDRVYGKDGWGI